MMRNLAKHMRLSIMSIVISFLFLNLILPVSKAIGSNNLSSDFTLTIESQELLYYSTLTLVIFVFILMVSIYIKYKREQNFKKVAYTDSLLNILNRNAFIDKLKEISASKIVSSIIILDIDDFKYANDILGQHNCDIILKAISKELQDMFEKGKIFRYSGDKFTILFENKPLSYAIEMSEQIVERFKSPWTTSDLSYRVSVSMGVVTTNISFDSYNAIISSLDYTLWQAKNSDIKQIVYFSEDLGRKIRHKNRVIDIVRRAIAEDNFIIYIQPILDIKTGTFKKGECLLRLRDDDGQFISPSEFVPLAEEMGLMTEIGKIVLRKVCEIAKKFIERDMNMQVFCINVSAMQFLQADFVETVINIIRESGLDPKHIMLELTESVLMDSLEIAKDDIQRLVDFGLLFSIDDFGTGYSGVNYVFNLPFSELKLDRSFIMQIQENYKVTSVIESIIDLCHRLDMSVVAEGVELKDQYEYLKAMECDMIQGFLFSKPIPVEQILESDGSEETMY